MHLRQAHYLAIRCSFKNHVQHNIRQPCFCWVATVTRLWYYTSLKIFWFLCPLNDSNWLSVTIFMVSYSNYWPKSNFQAKFRHWWLRYLWEIALKRLSWDLALGRSTLFEVIVWCRQAKSHYLNQCWPSPESPYYVTRPQWVKTIILVTENAFKILYHICSW